MHLYKIKSCDLCPTAKTNFSLMFLAWLSSWCWICPIFGVFAWSFKARKGRGFSKGKKLVSLPVYQWSTWHLALILYLCLGQLWLGFYQCWTSRLSGMLLKRCEWGVTSQQCSVQLPFLACVACAEFTGICIIGCFHQGGSNYATPGLVTNELCM